MYEAEGDILSLIDECIQSWKPSAAAGCFRQGVCTYSLQRLESTSVD